MNVRAKLNVTERSSRLIKKSRAMRAINPSFDCAQDRLEAYIGGTLTQGDGAHPSAMLRAIGVWSVFQQPADYSRGQSVMPSGLSSRKILSPRFTCRASGETSTRVSGPISTVYS
jgi:hypothetical protein